MNLYFGNSSSRSPKSKRAKSELIEIKWKGAYLDNRLRANVTLFTTQVTDAQTPNLVPELGFRIVTSNASNFSSAGFETEISANVAKGLQIDWNFGTTKAIYSKLSLPQTDYSMGESKWFKLIFREIAKY